MLLTDVLYNGSIYNINLTDFQTLMEKLNSVAKDEQKTSRPKSRRGRRKKKQEPSNPDPSNIKVNGPAKPKSPRKK